MFTPSVRAGAQKGYHRFIIVLFRKSEVAKMLEKWVPDPFSSFMADADAWCELALKI